MSAICSPSGEGLVLISSLLSLQIAQGKSAEDLAVIAALFTTLGDNLALIAAWRAVCGENGGEDGKDSVNSLDKQGESA